MVKLIPTMLTFSSLASASMALIALVVAPSSAARDVLIGTCIAWSMVADGLDGPLARKLDAQTSLGRHGVELGAVVVIPAVLWIGAAALRLARFAEDGIKKVGRFGPAFTGVPTPVAAAFLVSSVAVATLLGERLVEIAALIVGVMLMPSQFSYPKTGIGRWPWVVAVPVALAVLARHAFS
jgi:phosphatidylserine synthase